MSNELAAIWRLRARLRRQRHEIHFYRALVILLGGALCVLLFR